MREKVRRHRKGLIISLWVILSGLAGAGTFTLLVHFFGWHWTGFTQEKTSPNTRPEKTLWDWLQLLIIPAVLALGGFWFNAQQSERQQRLSDEQHRKDQEIAEGRRKAEADLAEKRRLAGIELEQEQQRENALQAYLDRMAELLLKENLDTSGEDNKVRQVARTQTLTVLRQLDPKRKATLLRFLYEAELLDREKVILILFGADLSGADLRPSMSTPEAPLGW